LLYQEFATPTSPHHVQPAPDYIFEISACQQAVIVTDPYMVAIVLDKASEVEKNSVAVYSQFNVVHHLSEYQPRRLWQISVAVNLTQLMYKDCP